MDSNLFTVLLKWLVDVTEAPSVLRESRGLLPKVVTPHDITRDLNRKGQPLPLEAQPVLKRLAHVAAKTIVKLASN